MNKRNKSNNKQIKIYILKYGKETERRKTRKKEMEQKESKKRTQDFLFANQQEHEIRLGDVVGSNPGSEKKKTQSSSRIDIRSRGNNEPSEPLLLRPTISSMRQNCLLK